MKRAGVAPDTLLYDGRRKAWIVTLPAADFIRYVDWRDRPAKIAERDFAVPPGDASEEREDARIPFALVTWAIGVWAFLLYALGHF